MNRSRLVCALVAGLMTFLAAARSQSAFSPPAATSSVSGQFIVSVTLPSNPYYRRADAGTNTDLLRLEPSLLAVSAERFKVALWTQIGMAANAPWSGKIFLALHPARTTDEDVVIAAQPFIRNWNYRVELPDLIPRNRCARAFSTVLLLELANRNAPVSGRSSVVPAWLADGLARQILEAAETKVILSAPTKTIDGLAQTRLDEKRRSLDSLAAARRTLQNFPALTFEQMSWPTDAQLNGNDDGVYLASAQLFVHDLLALKNGAANVRTLLAQLPAHENWQSAFFAAFRENFRRPLDVEKWWALRVVAFAARAPGPQWTSGVSRDKLAAALAVPVDVRYASNSLPTYAEISLQSALQNFPPERQVEIFQTKLRDLELIQLRLTPPLAPVAAGYHQALADFLGGSKKGFFHRPASASATIKKLDLLDAQRRDAEAKLKLSELQLDLNRTPP
ncbi:MAG TPA: hypothetical protein VIK62_09260 [Verrucomicrobiae bacterium]